MSRRGTPKTAQGTVLHHDSAVRKSAMSRRKQLKPIKSDNGAGKRGRSRDSRSPEDNDRDTDGRDSDGPDSRSDAEGSLPATSPDATPTTRSPDSSSVSSSPRLANGDRCVAPDDPYRMVDMHYHQRPLVVRFNCDFCGISFKNKTNLQAHKTYYCKAPPTIHRHCQICGLFMPSAENMQLHTRKVHPAYVQFVCLFCQTKFATKENLSHHLKVHYDVSGSCPVSHDCKPSSNAQEFVKHALKSHTIETNVMFEDTKVGLEDEDDKMTALYRSMRACFKCTEGFPSKREMVKHVCRHVTPETVGLTSLQLNSHDLVRLSVQHVAKLFGCKDLMEQIEGSRGAQSRIQLRSENMPDVPVQAIDLSKVKQEKAHSPDAVTFTGAEPHTQGKPDETTDRSHKPRDLKRRSPGIEVWSPANRTDAGPFSKLAQPTPVFITMPPTKHGTYNCDECNIRFTIKENYLAHKTLYCKQRHRDNVAPRADGVKHGGNEKPYAMHTCPYCSVKFNHVQNFEIHKSMYCLAKNQICEGRNSEDSLPDTAICTTEEPRTKRSKTNSPIPSTSKARQSPPTNETRHPPSPNESRHVLQPEDTPRRPRPCNERLQCQLCDAALDNVRGSLARHLSEYHRCKPSAVKFLDETDLDGLIEMIKLQSLKFLQLTSMKELTDNTPLTND